MKKKKKKYVYVCMSDEGYLAFEDEDMADAYAAKTFAQLVKVEIK